MRAMTQKEMDTISSYMRDEIREDLHAEIAPCKPETFLREYLKRDPEFINLLKAEFDYILKEVVL